jgi:hypothetical protein
LVLSGNQSSDYDNYTIAALTDELVLRLSEKCDCDQYDDDNGNRCLYIFRPYLNQAEGLLYLIRFYEHPPKFIIWKKDIPEKMAKALQDLGKVKMKKIITEVVRRLYESVDSDYFHTSGIYGKTLWTFGD